MCNADGLWSQWGFFSAATVVSFGSEWPNDIFYFMYALITQLFVIVIVYSGVPFQTFQQVFLVMMAKWQILCMFVEMYLHTHVSMYTCVYVYIWAFIERAVCVVLRKLFSLMGQLYLLFWWQLFFKSNYMYYVVLGIHSGICLQIGYREICEQFMS